MKWLQVIFLVVCGIAALIVTGSGNRLGHQASRQTQSDAAYETENPSSAEENRNSEIQPNFSAATALGGGWGTVGPGGGDADNGGNGGPDGGNGGNGGNGDNGGPGSGNAGNIGNGGRGNLRTPQCPSSWHLLPIFPLQF